MSLPYSMIAAQSPFSCSLSWSFPLRRGSPQTSLPGLALAAPAAVKEQVNDGAVGAVEAEAGDDRDTPAVPAEGGPCSLLARRAKPPLGPRSRPGGFRATRPGFAGGDAGRPRLFVIRLDCPRMPIRARPEDEQLEATGWPMANRGVKA